MIQSQILMKSPRRTTINRKSKSNPQEKEIKCSIWSNTTSGRTLFYVLFIGPGLQLLLGGKEAIHHSCSAMHPFRPTKPMVRICGIVGRNGCIALHYYVHFLRIFSFVTRGIESEGVGARSVRCLTPFV